MHQERRIPLAAKRVSPKAASMEIRDENKLITS
jgi:hypothetical protein